MFFRCATETVHIPSMIDWVHLKLFIIFVDESLHGLLANMCVWISVALVAAARLVVLASATLLRFPDRLLKFLFHLVRVTRAEQVLHDDLIALFLVKLKLKLYCLSG